jgi:hypothetical protein
MDALPRDPGVHVSKRFFGFCHSGFGASGELVFTFLRRTYPDRAPCLPQRDPPETASYDRIAPSCWTTGSLPNTRIQRNSKLPSWVSGTD